MKNGGVQLDGEPAGASLNVPLLRLPHAVEQFDHLLVDDEDDGHVQAHPAEPGNGSLVKPAQRGVVRRLQGRKPPCWRSGVNSRLRSLVLQDLEGTVCCVFVAMGL